jgi:putative ATP-binding cassette transporter
MIKLFEQMGRLLRLCIGGRDGKVSLLIFAVVVALNLGSVYATLQIIAWTGDFYAAVEKMDGSAALNQIGVFCLIIGLNSIRHLAGRYLSQILEIKWRESLTDAAIDVWTSNKAYWHLANEAQAIDNPDQRIAEDCRLFVRGLLGEALDLIQRIVGIFSYVALLWSLSNFPLEITLGSYNLAIQNYMVWAAFLYVILSSGITHFLGKPLKGLFVEQQKREASFRYSMARWRTNFDEVALANGESAERRKFKQNFQGIAVNWRKINKREFILGTFTYPFQHSVLRIPLFVALPGYFAGHVAFGGLMQLATAFSNVVTTLSWFIFSYKDLADLVATTARLDHFIQRAKQVSNIESRFSTTNSGQTTRISNFAIDTPDGRRLINIPDMTIHRGDVIWLRGASGIGKSTFTKVLAGLWRFGAGTIEMAAGRWMILPQRAWLPVDCLMEAAAYPSQPDEFGRSRIMATLASVGLGCRHCLTTTGLSGGEAQRLAIARVLLHRPDWVVLDEATSALDIKSEVSVLKVLRDALPDTTFIIVSHRAPSAIESYRIIELAPAETAVLQAI